MGNNFNKILVKEGVNNNYMVVSIGIHTFAEFKFKKTHPLTNTMVTQCMTLYLSPLQNSTNPWSSAFLQKFPSYYTNFMYRFRCFNGQLEW